MCIRDSFNSATMTPLPTNTAVIAPSTDTPVPLPTDTPIPINTGNVLLDDDFSVSRDSWGTLDGEKSSVKYDNDSLRMKLFEKNYVVWSRPNDEDYEDIHAEAVSYTHLRAHETPEHLVCR